MPFLGLGLHVLLALLCGIHAIRNGQPLYWLIILFSFPLLGSVVYFVAIYLPQSRVQRTAGKVMASAVKVLDPSREVREARLALEDTPTAQNQMRLAAALLAMGEAEEAAQRYQACLQGPFASDPDIRLGAAQAWVACERFQEALPQLTALRQERPEFRVEAVALLTARSLAGTGRAAEARAELEAAVARFDTYESRAELAIWAYGAGDLALAARLSAELDKLASRSHALAREHREAVNRRLQAARKSAGVSRD